MSDVTVPIFLLIVYTVLVAYHFFNVGFNTAMESVQKAGLLPPATDSNKDNDD